MSSTMDYNTIKYPKMDSFRKGLITGLNPNESYVCVEKLHGSNTQFFYEGSVDGPLWKLGKRNGWITDAEMINFYHIGKAYQPYISDLIAACESACYEQGMDSRHCQVSIFSELYGARIQKGMLYHDEETIAVFDIRVNGLFLPYDQVRELCENHNLPMAPEICRGTLGELVSTFQVEELYSHVPLVLHKKDVPEAPCEGVILRPMSQDGFENRFKWKKQAFRECQVKHIPSEGENRDVLLACQYMNTQRLECYLSKVGPDTILNRKNTGTNIRALIQDALEDVKQDFPELWLEKAQVKKVSKILSGKAAQLINKFIFEYVPVELTEEEQVSKIEKNMQETREIILDVKNQLIDIRNRLSVF